MNTTFYTLSGSAFASRDSVVGMATGLRAGRSGDRIPAGAETFLFYAFSGLALGPHPASHSVGT